MNKGGRPVAKEPRNNKVSLRVTDAHLQQIRDYAAEHDMTIAEVIKAGLDLLMNAPKAK